MKKILIVEDDKALVELIVSKLIDRTDAKILIAHNYKDAVSLIREHENSIAVAIVDLHLPGSKDGGVLHLTNINEIPSIVLTSSSDKLLRQSMMQKHVLEYIVKSDLHSLQYAADVTIRVLRNYDTGVLIVDDSAVALNVMALSLEKLNVKIFKAQDGEEALEVLEKHGDAISLVLTDYQMPHMDGLELTQAIRKIYRKDRMAVIVLSGADDRSAVFDFFKVGANDFLTKPFNFEEFFIRMNINLDLIDMFRYKQTFANKDPLTGLFNKKFFLDSGMLAVEKAKRAKAPCCVILFEVDKYGAMADRYGNEVGRGIVLSIVNILNDTLRKSDLLAQYEINAFAILFDEHLEENVKKVTERLRQKFEKDHLEYGGKQIKYTVSMGVYFGAPQDIAKMVASANAAMLVSKGSGGNRVSYV